MGYKTSGELVADFVRGLVIIEAPTSLDSRYSFAGDYLADWHDFIDELVILNAVARLVRSAQYILDQMGGGDALQTQQVEGAVREIFPLLARPERKSLAGLASRAAAASRDDIPTSTRRRLEGPYRCYLCGLLADPTSPLPHHRPTIDHVWPQTFGGDSDLDNLLVACVGCNNHKSHLMSWAQAGVQGNVWPPHASDAALATVPREIAIAALLRKASEHARRLRTSLKVALLEIGPTTQLSLIDHEQPGDFFNLRFQP